MPISVEGAIGHFNPQHSWIRNFADHQAIQGSGDLVAIRATRITGEFLAEGGVLFCAGWSEKLTQWSVTPL
jgi:hypothetical protein